jgi:alpha-glucosidase
VVSELLSAPHHDGSEVHVCESPSGPGDETTVLLRVPRGSAVDAVVLRYLRDGEPKAVAATVDRVTEADTWWRASFPVWNPATAYRWLLSGGDYGYTWLNGVGLQPFDVPDADDFVATLDPGGPDWHLESVVYEIFPDRFASSGLAVEPPEWAVPREWDALPDGRSRETSVEWFGGDLPGVEERLDHVAALGANVIYLTPIFPARSVHRYDASTFGEVDPLLGGDAALAALTAAAHERGIRVLGDLTTNHVGSSHEWFVAAREGHGPEREFFYFDDTLPYGYECWAGVPTLPKLDYRSCELRSRVYGDGASVVRHWLEPPFALDGWRIDVAHLTGRRRDQDALVEVSQGVRAAAVAARPDALVVAEHGHDARADLRVGGWHGTMNYAGFTRPVWTWLRGDVLPPVPAKEFVELPVGVPRLAGEAVVESMRRFRAGVPWSAALHSWVILDSHDTARFRTIAGSRDRQLVGIGLQMTTPGVPMLFAGDEVGLEGEWGEDSRRTMPWGRPDTWDGELLEAYRGLIALRRGSRALARGGIRYAHVSADAIAYVREAVGETVLCLAVRAGERELRVPLAALDGVELETLWGEDARVEDGDAVLPAAGPAFHVWGVGPTRREDD